jgi:outer membrane protein assembly factor BamD (BamD/ComL family)
MRRSRAWHAMILALVVAAPAGAQTATELKKELFLKWKKAQAAGVDLGEAGKLYKEGDEALRQGLQEEALDYFQQAKDAWPAAAQ